MTAGVRSRVGSCRIEIISKHSDEIVPDSRKKLLIYRLVGTIRRNILKRVVTQCVGVGGSNTVSDVQH